MNLWVKRALPLLGVVVLLASCEDDSFLLGFKNQKPKFKGIYQEITLGTSEVISLDSTITDTGTGTNLLVGEYNDSYLGIVRAEAYTELRPQISTVITVSDGQSAIYDSVVFEFQTNYYSYGLVGSKTEKFNVHRITGDTLTYWDNQPDTSIVGGHRYYTNSTVVYDPTPLGEASVELVFDTLQANLATSSRQDTIQARARLDDAFGQELFNVMLNNPGEALSDLNKFRYEFKGLALIPTQSTAIIGYSPTSGLSHVRIHYHTEANGEVVDTLSRDALLTGISFNNITPTRSGDFATITMPHEGYDLGSGVRAIQSGDPLVTKIDIAPFYSFMDTLSTDIIINSAQLIIEPIGVTDETPPIKAFELRSMRNDYEFYKFYVSSDSAFMHDYLIPYSQNSGFDIGMMAASSGAYTVISDYLSQSSLSASMSYNSTSEQYLSNLTRYFQALISRKSIPMDQRMTNFVLYPATSSTGLSLPYIGKAVDRTIFNKNSVKLRIYYTRAVVSN